MLKRIDFREECSLWNKKIVSELKKTYLRYVQECLQVQESTTGRSFNSIARSTF